MENDAEAFSWALAVFLVGTVTAVSIAIAVVGHQVASIFRARAGGAHEEQYRKLAAEMSAAMTRTSEQLERQAEELAALRERTAEIERLMREV